MLPSISLRDILPDPTRVEVLNDLDAERLQMMVGAGVELKQPDEKWSGFLTLLWNRAEKSWGFMAGVRSPDGELAQGNLVFGEGSRKRSMQFVVPHPDEFKPEPALISAMGEFEVATAKVGRLSDIENVAAVWGPWFKNIAVGMERVKRNLPPASISVTEGVAVAKRQLQYMVPASWVPQKAIGSIVKGMWKVGNLTIDGGGQITIHNLDEVSARSNVEEIF
jgi:hypothetical protein